MWRVLLVDDDAKYRAAVRANLERVGHWVYELGRGLEAISIVRAVQCDIVLLDVNLPDTRGTAVCQCLKADPSTAGKPVIIATARSDEETRVEAFEHGADDFMVKPFSFRELLLRMRVLVEGVPMQPTGALRIGRLAVDFDTCRVVADGIRLHLSKTELALLRALSEEPLRVWPRDKLLDVVWGVEADVDDRVVDGLVRRLREKLGVCASCVETVRGVGYRLAADTKSPLSR